MGTLSVPKPHSLRLPAEIDAQVRAYAQSLAQGGRSRVPVGKALVALIEAGLDLLQAAPSPKDGLHLALRELDPEWSGRPLGDRKPATITTRSGRSAAQILLDRRG